MELGEKIKKLRQEKGMTLEQVGNLVGVGKSTVRKWENGDIANMRRDKIAKIAKALGTTPAYLMGWDEQTETMPVKIETDDDLYNLADTLEMLGAKEEAVRLRSNTEETRQLLTFIKLFSALSPEDRLSLISKMIEMQDK